MRWLWHVGAAAARLSRRPIGERRASDGRPAPPRIAEQIVPVVVKPTMGRDVTGAEKSSVASSAKSSHPKKLLHFRGRFVTPMSTQRHGASLYLSLAGRSAPTSPARTRSDAGLTACRHRHSRALLRPLDRRASRQGGRRIIIVQYRFRSAGHRQVVPMMRSHKN